MNLSHTQTLQKCLDFVAQHVPSLAGARAIRFVRQYEIWTCNGECLISGSYASLLLWLGCVVTTKAVRPFGHYPPEILNYVYFSYELWMRLAPEPNPYWNVSEG